MAILPRASNIVTCQSPEKPGVGQVLVGVEFAPINFSDILVARGLYPLRPHPIWGCVWMLDIMAGKPKPTNTEPGLIYMLNGAIAAQLHRSV